MRAIRSGAGKRPVSLRSVRARSAVAKNQDRAEVESRGKGGNTIRASNRANRANRAQHSSARAAKAAESRSEVAGLDLALEKEQQRRRRSGCAKTPVDPAQLFPKSSRPRFRGRRRRFRREPGERVEDAGPGRRQAVRDASINRFSLPGWRRRATARAAARTTVTSCTAGGRLQAADLRRWRSPRISSPRAAAAGHCCRDRRPAPQGSGSPGVADRTLDGGRDLIRIPVSLRFAAASRVGPSSSAHLRASERTPPPRYGRKLRFRGESESAGRGAAAGRLGAVARTPGGTAGGGGGAATVAARERRAAFTARAAADPRASPAFALRIFSARIDVVQDPIEDHALSRVEDRVGGGQLRSLGWPTTGQALIE